MSTAFSWMNPPWSPSSVMNSMPKSRVMLVWYRQQQPINNMRCPLHVHDQLRPLQVSKCKFPSLSRLDLTRISLSSVLPVSVERSTSVQHKIQQQREHQALLASLTALFDEPRVSEETLRIYENCVAVAQQGSFEPSDADRQVYVDYVASLMINVQS